MAGRSRPQSLAPCAESGRPPHRSLRRWRAAEAMAEPAQSCFALAIDAHVWQPGCDIRDLGGKRFGSSNHEPAAGPEGAEQPAQDCALMLGVEVRKCEIAAEDQVEG